MNKDAGNIWLQLSIIKGSLMSGMGGSWDVCIFSHDHFTLRDSSPLWTVYFLSTCIADVEPFRVPAREWADSTRLLPFLGSGFQRWPCAVRGAPQPLSLLGRQSIIFHQIDNFLNCVSCLCKISVKSCIYLMSSVFWGGFVLFLSWVFYSNTTLTWTYLNWGTPCPKCF